MIYGYCRVSTYGQKKDGNSIEDQHRRIAERYPTAQFIDEAYSGAKQRPKFNRLLEELTAGDVLVVTKLDRFCRTVKEGLEYIDELMNRGIRIHILNMGLIEESAYGRLIVTTLLAFAEFERSIILERTQDGKAVAKQKEGYREGRPRKELPLFSDYYSRVEAGELTVSAACKEMQIARSTWYKTVERMAS